MKRFLVFIVLTVVAANTRADERPNIVILFADDMGYSDIGCFGSEIETPNLDRMADHGLRFSHFYNTGRCCPSRASIMTGLYPHQADIGHMAGDTGHSGYRDRLSFESVTIAEVLKDAGYRTLMTGKWHLGWRDEGCPTARGFEKFYGTRGYIDSYFTIVPRTEIYLDEKLVLPVGEHPVNHLKPKETWYTTDVFTDYALKFIDDVRQEDDQPFFLYLAYNAPHFPLHAHPDDVKKYRGRYRDGWDQLRQQRYRRLVESGLIDPQWQLSPPDVPKWESLSEKQRDDLDFKMSLFAAIVDRLDQNVGRVLDHLRDIGQLDNTMVIFVSDNGGTKETGLMGIKGDKNNVDNYDQWARVGGWTSSYGQGWANLSNVPFRLYKRFNHEGGISAPMIVHWPKGMKETGRVTHQVSHLVDIMATCVDVAEASYPETFGGNSIQPMEGKSLRPVLQGESIGPRRLYWEHEGHRAIRDGKWKLVATDQQPWELYDMSVDRSELNDLSSQRPVIATRLGQQWQDWADRVDVLPPEEVRRLRKEWNQAQKKASRDKLVRQSFVNPIGEGADPWVVRDPNRDRYLWCMSEGNRAIVIHTSDRLTSLGAKHVVWRAPETGPVSREVWAPELHFLDGKWHVYFAASDGDNKNHLTYVLRSESDDPLGPYELIGPLATGDGEDRSSPNVWAIDMTVLTVGDKRYAVWSGWDAPGTDRQYLYIAAMASPTELQGPRVRICANDDHLWERVEPSPEKRGLNEGPQIFQSKGRTTILYSCGASWLPTYKLGALELKKDADPLAPTSWTKRERPAFDGSDSVFGVGHACFVPSPDGKQWWQVFHAKRDRSAGWQRDVHVQPFKVDADGRPDFGSPSSRGTLLRRPSGEKARTVGLPFHKSLRADENLSGWSYYGHHQFTQVRTDGLHLGVVPESPINAYRSGEKVVLDGALPSNIDVDVTIDFQGNQNSRDAGILFRCTAPSVGFDAQRGYFAGLIPRTGLVILGKTDGTKWKEIARANVKLDTRQTQRLGVRANGDHIEIRLQGKTVIEHDDSTHSAGSVGLRVVDTHAAFRDIELKELR